MNWLAVREAYPNQWLIIEALNAHTAPDRARIIELMSVIEQCADGASAFARYRALRQQIPEREFYFVHTRREELDIHVVPDISGFSLYRKALTVRCPQMAILFHHFKTQDRIHGSRIYEYIYLQIYHSARLAF